MSQTIQQFIELYQTLNKDNINTLRDVYHPEVVFQDPVHQIRGLTALQSYFQHLYSNIEQCNFTIKNYQVDDKNGYVNWTMKLAHPRIENGRLNDIDGVTQLTFKDGKVIYHRDFFDMGCMLYEKLPLLGSVIRFLKRAMVPAELLR